MKSEVLRSEPGPTPMGVNVTFTFGQSLKFNHPAVSVFAVKIFFCSNVEVRRDTFWELKRGGRAYGGGSDF